MGWEEAGEAVILGSSSQDLIQKINCCSYFVLNKKKTELATMKKMLTLLGKFT